MLCFLFCAWLFSHFYLFVFVISLLINEYSGWGSVVSNQHIIRSMCKHSNRQYMCFLLNSLKHLHKCLLTSERSIILIRLQHQFRYLHRMSMFWRQQMFFWFYFHWDSVGIKCCQRSSKNIYRMRFFFGRKLCIWKTYVNQSNEFLFGQCKHCSVISRFDLVIGSKQRTAQILLSISLK